MQHKSPIIIPWHLILGKGHYSDFLIRHSVPLPVKQVNSSGSDMVEDQKAVMCGQIGQIYGDMTLSSSARQPAPEPKMMTRKPHAGTERDRDGAKKNCDQLLYRFGAHYSDIDHHGLVMPLLASHNIHFLVLELLILSIVTETHPCDCIHRWFILLYEQVVFFSHTHHSLLFLKH